MAYLEQTYEDDIHPIDIVESLANTNDWDFDRIAEDQIAMAIEGQWRTYSLTLAWCAADQTLRLICTFEMEPGTEKLPALYEGLNAINEQSWCGNFSWWADNNLMVFRYGLLLADDITAAPEQIDRMITSAFLSCERYYPAFQLMVWGDQTPKQALQVAIAEAYGRA
jgi:hypothetical protein